MDTRKSEDEPPFGDTVVTQNAGRSVHSDRKEVPDDAPTGIYARPPVEPAPPEVVAVTPDPLKRDELNPA
jgi:hypothetical protein